MESKKGKQGKKKRLPGAMKLFVMNSDSYLFTIEEAALINRKNRNAFRNDFLNLGFEIIMKDKKEFIRHDEIKKYHAHYTRVLTESN